MVERSYAECHLCLVSIMLVVTNKPIMLNVVMLSVIMLSIVVPLIEIVFYSILGSKPTYTHYTTLETLARDKHYLETA